MYAGYLSCKQTRHFRSAKGVRVTSELSVFFGFIRAYAKVPAYAGLVTMLPTLALLARFHAILPGNWMFLRGTFRPWLLRYRTSWPTERFSKMEEKIKSMRSCTSRLGSFWTRPSSSRTRPTGNRTASSPRFALLHLPAFSRAESCAFPVRRFVLSIPAAIAH